MLRKGYTHSYWKFSCFCSEECARIIIGSSVVSAPRSVHTYWKISCFCSEECMYTHSASLFVSDGKKVHDAYKLLKVWLSLIRVMYTRIRSSVAFMSPTSLSVEVQNSMRPFTAIHTHCKFDCFLLRRVLYTRIVKVGLFVLRRMHMHVVRSVVLAPKGVHAQLKIGCFCSYRCTRTVEIRLFLFRQVYTHSGSSVVSATRGVHAQWKFGCFCSERCTRTVGVGYIVSAPKGVHAQWKFGCLRIAMVSTDTCCSDLRKSCARARRRGKGHRERWRGSHTRRSW